MIGGLSIFALPAWAKRLSGHYSRGTAPTRGAMVPIKAGMLGRLVDSRMNLAVESIESRQP